MDSRYGGTLRVRGETVDKTATARFIGRDSAPTAELMLDLEQEFGVIPGSATAREVALYSYHPSYILYPKPGCWRITATLGSEEVGIIVRKALC